MRVFVWELICSGALSHNPRESPLIDEGFGMLSGILEDLATFEDLSLTTLWDRRLGAAPVPGAIATGSPALERKLFEDTASSADLTLVIAPESGNQLGGRLDQLESLSLPTANCSSTAARCLGDKLQTATLLQRLGIPTPPTQSVSAAAEVPPASSFPLVVKPTDGAGADRMLRLESGQQWVAHARELAHFLDSGHQLIRQPWLSGQHRSAAFLVGSSPSSITPLPVCTQQLQFASDGRVSYGGGVVTPELPNPRLVEDIELLLGELPGIRGYIGLDYLDHGPDREPTVIECNPRLTTSFLGYRQWFGPQLARVLCGLGELSVVRPPPAAIPFAPHSLDWEPSTGNPDVPRGTCGVD